MDFFARKAALELGDSLWDSAAAAAAAAVVVVVVVLDQ